MRNNLPYQPFVILGTARTGTSMLWSYLNSHPDILCLRGVYGSKNKINFGKFYGELPDEYHSSELIMLRNERPIEFLENYVWKEYSKSYRAVGFKYFYDHNRHLSSKNELINAFQENKFIKFLHLKRHNLLETLFSYKRSLSQKQWTNNNSDFKTLLPINECNDYFHSILKSQTQFDLLFVNRSIEVKYDNLLNEPKITLQSIMQFIGVENIELTFETQKSKSIKLSDGIMNFEELKNHFRNTEFSVYFEN